MRNPEHAKYFEDVDVDNLGFGGLGGAAIDNHQKARPQPSREGVKTQLYCDNCGAPNILTMDWTEVIVISAGAIPPGWKYEQGHIRPEIGCAHCRKHVGLGFTPDEAKRWVTAAINARFVDPNQANAIVQQATRGGVR